MDCQKIEPQILNCDLVEIKETAAEQLQKIKAKIARNLLLFIKATLME